jgi:hypothetical protein
MTIKVDGFTIYTPDDARNSPMVQEMLVSVPEALERGELEWYGAGMDGWKLQVVAEGIAAWWLVQVGFPPSEHEKAKYRDIAYLLWSNACP